jgi:hypothetical protein
MFLLRAIATGIPMWPTPAASNLPSASPQRLRLSRRNYPWGREREGEKVGNLLFLLYCSVRVLLMAMLLPYFRLFHCFEAEKNSAHNHLVVDEAENMSQMRASNFTKSYSFYDTHDDEN